MQINWVVVTYWVIGFFAVAGFFRGWWKEAITALFLGILVLFLQQPTWAQAFIDLLNNFLVTLWGVIPDSLKPIITHGLETLFSINTGGGPLQADPSAPGTWLTILALAIALSILIGRLALGYPPTLRGSLLGLLLGGLNGFIALSLVREYLDGRSLPGSVPPSPAEISLAGGSSFGPAATDLSIQATNLPSFTILDSLIPWIVVLLGLLFGFSALKTRLGMATNSEGMKKVDYKVPPFYKQPKKVERRQPGYVIVQDQQ
jgi:hypothetical protein